MRILITAIVLWAIILGFMATGVKVMATSPVAADVTAVTVTINDDLQRVDREAGNSRAKFLPAE